MHRPNLLLGLIIRQRLKRQHSANAGAGAGRTAETSDSAPVTVPPDKKSKTEVSTEGSRKKVTFLILYNRIAQTEK